MPKVSFYLRNDDLAAWRVIEHKTEFIHNALTEDHPPVTKIPRESLVYGQGVFADAIEAAEEAKLVEFDDPDGFLEADTYLGKALPPPPVPRVTEGSSETLQRHHRIEAPKEDAFKFCKHENVVGFCKKGCK